MKHRLIVFLIPAMLFAIGLGCSGSGVNPAAPDIIENDKPVQALDAGTWLLNYYDIYFDIENQTFEAVENRSASLTLNIVPFLNKMISPPNGITFDQIVLHQDDPAFLGVDVVFTIYHPFPGYPQYEAYDVRGILIGDGALGLEYAGLNASYHGTDLWMKNPDGYTRWFNPTEFTTELIFGYAPGGWQNYAGDATLNPYKYYARSLEDDGDVWDFLTGENHWDGIFVSGSGRMMELEFPWPPVGNGVAFGYAVAVCWEEQGPTGPYYPVHVPEAVAASINITPNIWYNETDGSGGSLILDIDLFGWDYQPSTIKIESSVLENIEEFDFDTFAQVGGEHYSTWNVEAVAKPLNTADNHFYWVIAECGALDYANGLPDIPHADGSIAAFFRYDLYIADEPYSAPPEIISGVDGDDTPSYSATAEQYSVTATDSDPLTYDWTVTDLASSLEVTTGITDNMDGTIDIDWSNIDGAPGIPDDQYLIECEVTDGFSAPVPATPLTVTLTNTAPSCSVEVTDPLVTPPEGWAPFNYTFDSGASDPDEDFMDLTYDWDFDGDLLYFTADGDMDDHWTGDDWAPVHGFQETPVGPSSVKVTDEYGLESECFLADMLVLPVHRSKNIPLRDGYKALDLGVDPEDGDLYILYDDHSTYIYKLDDWYATHSSYFNITQYFDCNMVDVAAGGWGIYTRKMSNPSVYVYDGSGNLSFGSGWGGGENKLRDVCNMGMTGQYDNDLHYFIGYFHTTMSVNIIMPRSYLDESGYASNPCYYSEVFNYTYDGITKAHQEYVQAIDSGTEGDNYWYLEAPDYYCAAFIQTGSGYWRNPVYNNSYFGTGTEETDDTCWTADVCDLGHDADGRFHVLDKIDDEAVIKVFSGSSSGGTAHGSYGDEYSILSTPLRLDGSDFDGNMIVLHGNPTDGYFISVFLPSEFPS